MPAVHILGANQINADVAGKTAGAVEQAGAPAAATLSEIIHGELDLSSVLGGGRHPENVIPAIFSTDIQQATDSVTGRHGGLIPAAGSVLQPGPAGGAAAAKTIIGTIPTRISGLFKKS